ncbi:MAG: hypothetical protein M3Q45_03510 [Chloroflexota bacterium]|nr:hypothetical protein [Chloroflexota bacterium]
MANLRERAWFKRFITLCLLLLLLGLVGHFLADASGFSLDSFASLTLHSSFMADVPVAVVPILAMITFLLPAHARPTHWSIPPTTPPPIHLR